MTRTRFHLTVVGVNWGRGYDPGDFARNVTRVLRFTNGREHVVLLPQEVDEEPDPAHEHARLASMLVPKSRRVHWKSREPIILSPAFKVVHRSRRKIMGSGAQIDPRFRGVGPERWMTRAIAEYEGVLLGFGNWHPHRSGLNAKVDEARDVGADKASAALTDLSERRGGISGAYATDYNSRRMPEMVDGERVGHHQGLDHLRYWQHPNGARIERVAHGSLEGTIDPHDPIWSRFVVEGR